MSDKGRKTRKRIIDQSAQLFSVKGFYNTSIGDILEITGLTKGGLYGHFQSKEDIWYAVYEEAAKKWRETVLKETRRIPDPLERLEKMIENDLIKYLGGSVFDGGCFFLNCLVELSGQSDSMCRHVLQGYTGLGIILRSWLEEAHEKGLLKDNLELKEIADFIVISLNGAAALYASTGDLNICRQTHKQMHFYINQLRKS